MNNQDSIQADSVNELVTLRLLHSQAADLWPLVNRQATDRKGLIFITVAPHLTLGTSWAFLQLQAVFMPHKTANKILKLIKADLTPKSSTV